MKKKSGEKKAGIAVAVKILPTWEIDCSSWIGDVPLDQWTRGPILPVGGEQRSARKGKRAAKGRKKKRA